MILESCVQKLKAISALLMHKIAQTSLFFSFLLLFRGRRGWRQILPCVDGKTDKKEKIETSLKNKRKDQNKAFPVLLPRPLEPGKNERAKG